MRIALLCHGGPLRSMGGVGLYVEALGAALVAAGHAVVVVSPYAADPPPGVEAWRPPPPQNPTFQGTWACSARRASLRAFFRRWRPDVVHVHHTDGLGFDGPTAAAVAAHVAKNEPFAPGDGLTMMLEQLAS